MVESLRSLVLAFAAVVVLLIGIKWIYLWRRVQRMGRNPGPGNPPQ